MGGIANIMLFSTYWVLSVSVVTSAEKQVLVMHMFFPL